tara:strand:- start:413 stop:622 length:210 start_codon:yes stop_codon:yes gene_type:complete
METAGLTVNIAENLDWALQANIAIMLIENGEGEQGKEEGRKLVREMAEKLDQIRKANNGKALKIRVEQE